MVSMTRRQFGFAAAAVGLLGIDAVAQPVTPSVQLPDGSRVPTLGQGSATLAQGRHPASEEEDALRLGISLGLTLLDTAELYGNGGAERMLGRGTDELAGGLLIFAGIAYERLWRRTPAPPQPVE